ncbi:MAG: HEAT repeat domain-containing protein [Blastocatellia bacterium]|nr:HEAT repeat domain-containing protein [Blastocatellia bacterium]
MSKGTFRPRFVPALFLLLQMTLHPTAGWGGTAPPGWNRDNQPAPRLPPVNWARPRKFDVQHLALDLRFDWPRKQAHGTAVITLVPLAATDRIALDAAYFTITAVTSGHGAPLSFDYDGGDKNENLRIRLGREYRAGEAVTVKIAYRTNWVNHTDPDNLSGSTGKGLRFFEPTSNDQTRPREIWSMGDPEGNRYWFPGFDAPNDVRTTELTATVAKPLSVISNGMLLKTKDNGDGTRTFHWKTETPYPNHLTALVVGEYVDVQQVCDGIELHNFAYPGEVEAVKATVARLPEMLRFFSQTTGVKYPYPSYAQVSAQDLPWGTANHMFSTQTENMIDDDRTHADFLYLWDGLEAETLAHQWFGNYLNCSDWSHVWLNRGFAHYFDGLFNESKNGHDEFLLWQLRADHSTYLSDWNAGLRHPVVTRNYENAEGFAADNYPYVRGAAVLHMLRKHLGDEIWGKAIRHYVKTHGGQLVSTEDFRKSVEAVSGEPLDWFFDQWLYKMGHPVFSVTKAYDPAAQRLTLTVKQVQTVDPAAVFPQTQYFAGKVEVEIDGRIEPVWLEPKAENVFSWPATQSPKLVNFDFESTWIKEIKFEKTLDELLYQVRHDRDVLGRRWALDELVAQAQKPDLAATDKNRICAELRNLIQSPAYWRLRLAALQQLQNLLAPPPNSQPAMLDAETLAMLHHLIRHETSWNRAAALNFLGLTQNPQYADLYCSFFNDPSDRVVNAAAIALGRSKSPQAFEALAKLVNRPSWKNQSLMSALSGLQQLGDPRGSDIALKALADGRLLRWRLPTPPVWDVRVIAVNTLVALGNGEAAGPLLQKHLAKAVEENDLSGMFNNLLLLTKVAHPQGQEVFSSLRTKFKDDPKGLETIRSYEAQFNENLKAAAAKRN